MATSEFIVCKLLGCGELDIETMFGTITDNDLFSEALEDLKAFGEFPDANSIWYRAMELAIYIVFGDEMLDSFEIDANCMASSVSFLGDTEDVDDFKDKAEKFKEMTGFSINY